MSLCSRSMSLMTSNRERFLLLPRPSFPSASTEDVPLRPECSVGCSSSVVYSEPDASCCHTMAHNIMQSALQSCCVSTLAPNTKWVIRCTDASVAR